MPYWHAYSSTGLTTVVNTANKILVLAFDRFSIFYIYNTFPR